MKTPLLLSLAALLMFSITAPANTIKVTWGYNSQAGAVHIYGNDGSTLLSGADNGGATGTGFAVELGYYSQATAANPFAGTWVPVFGKGDANPLFATASLGDGRTTADDGTDIRFSLTGVIDSAVPATLTSLPPAGQIMAIRYYNAAQPANATYYGTASNPAWQWVAPSDVPPLPLSFNASQSGTVFQGGTYAETNQRTFTGQPQISQQPSNVSGTMGTQFTFNVSATGPGLTYQWFLNGTPIAGATSAAYNFMLTSDTVGSYTVQITDAYGDTTTGGPYLASIGSGPSQSTDTPAMPLVAELGMFAALFIVALRYLGTSQVVLSPSARK